MKRPITLALLLAAACTSGKTASDSEQALKNIGAVVVLQRAPRMGGVGDVFQYTTYAPGAKLVKLEPPTADGTRTELCCDAFPEMAGLDIQSYDISFDARSIVFAGRIDGDSHYGIYILTLDEKGQAAGAPRRLPTNPMHDYVYPIFSTRDRIIYVTNEVVEEGAKQFRDEYERGTTTQLGSMTIGGTDPVLGPRNLSHRVAPTLMSDGRVLFTQWEHLGDRNAGHLMMINPDFTTQREAFGSESTGVVNSYLKAEEIEPGRVVAIGTSRDRTVQSGKLLDIRLGKTVDGVFRQSEANAQAIDLTPQVPEREASSPTVGRYYSAYAVRSVNGQFGEKPLFLVSWADGPVEEMVLGAAKKSPDFGVYLYDSSTRQRFPVLNDVATWDVLPRPLVARAAPPAIDESSKNGYSDEALLIGSLDVHVSSLNKIEAGSIVKVRVIEGFSVEEGIPDDFGLTEHEGAARLGEAPVFSDGSWAALVPANVPIHLQPLDRFGMAVVNEPVWFSGRPGEQRFCGGCHEDRAKTSVISPGITMALAARPPTFDRPRANRRSEDYNGDKTVGVPWDKALQPIFDKKCVACHDGDASKPGNKSLTLTDEEGMVQTIVFDLHGDAADYNIGGEMLSGYSKSHLSMMGFMMGDLIEANITVTGDLKPYMEAGSARTSTIFNKLNPRQIYGDPNVRFKAGMPTHPKDVGGQELTDNEMYLLIMAADMGGQFYSRENAPGGSGYGN